MKFLLVLNLLIFGSNSLCWTPNDKHLYSQRHFLELAHILVMQKKTSLAKNILAQESDLRGCRQIHRGSGGIESLLECVRFINREDELGLVSPKRSNLISDINILCGRYVLLPNNLPKILELKVFNQRNWAKCVEFTWEQVYLTVYANFDADPSGSLGLLRQAQEALGTHSHWAVKALSLFETKRP